MKRNRVFELLHKRFRARRFRNVERIIRPILGEKNEISILDVGGRPAYWEMLPKELRSRVRITCLNFESELTEYSSQATDLLVTQSVGDGCNLSQFEDQSFDLVHSNSVIEHVGPLGRMATFAAETRRVGRAYYVQTPSFWFPIEPHYAFPFIHWLPEQARLWLHTHVSLGYARKCTFETALKRIDHTRMISGFMLKRLFPDAEIKKERFLLVFVKSNTAIRPD